MITLENINPETIKGKNLLFGFSRETGELTSVAVVEKTGDAEPSLSGWLKEYPEDSETEEFKLADAWAWLAANAGGYGRLESATLAFDRNGKVAEIR